MNQEKIFPNNKEIYLDINTFFGLDVHEYVVITTDGFHPDGVIYNFKVSKEKEDLFSFAYHKEKDIFYRFDYLNSDIVYIARKAKFENIDLISSFIPKENNSLKEDLIIIRHSWCMSDFYELGIGEGMFDINEHNHLSHKVYEVSTSELINDHFFLRKLYDNKVDKFEIFKVILLLIFLASFLIYLVK